MNRFVLIDGNAIMHRAYHALPPLTTCDGQPINAVYGFTSMLLRIIQDLMPSVIIVTFDRPEPTFRKKLFANYQSHRPEMENTLSSQFKDVKEVVNAMKIPILEKAGYEADDVLGTIAERIQNSEFRIQNKKRKIDEVIIVTGDRDILQLVNDHVKVYMPVKGLSEAKLYGPEEVMEKFGLAPEQIPDYKALIGDPSDNYPGVNGIGPKTAVTLLTRYKTVEELYNHLDKEKNEKLVEKLKIGKKDAEMSKKLATIVCDVPLKLYLSTLSAPEVDSDAVMKLFEKFEFHSLMKRLMVGSRKETGSWNPSTKLRTRLEAGKEKKDDDRQLSLL